MRRASLASGASTRSSARRRAVERAMAPAISPAAPGTGAAAPTAAALAWKRAKRKLDAVRLFGKALTAAVPAVPSSPAVSNKGKKRRSHSSHHRHSGHHHHRHSTGHRSRHGVHRHHSSKHHHHSHRHSHHHRRSKTDDQGAAALPALGTISENHSLKNGNKDLAKGRRKKGGKKRGKSRVHRQPSGKPRRRKTHTASRANMKKPARLTQMDAVLPNKVRKLPRASSKPKMAESAEESPPEQRERQAVVRVGGSRRKAQQQQQQQQKRQTVGHPAAAAVRSDSAGLVDENMRLDAEQNKGRTPWGARSVVAPKRQVPKS